MGKSQHLTMMDLRSGDLPQLVKVKTHIRVSPQKVYKLRLPMLSSCCIWVTHIFWGGFFASLSVSFSPYMRMYLCTCTSNPCGDIALILACFSPTASRIGRVRRDHAPCKTEPVQLEDVCTHKGGQAGKPAGWEDEAKSAWCMEGFHHSRIPPIFGPARAS